MVPGSKESREASAAMPSGPTPPVLLSAPNPPPLSSAAGDVLEKHVEEYLDGVVWLLVPFLLSSSGCPALPTCGVCPEAPSSVRPTVGTGR